MGSAVNIIFVDFINMNVRPGAVFTVPDVLEILCKVPPDKAFCAGDKYVQNRSSDVLVLTLFYHIFSHLYTKILNYSK